MIYYNLNESLGIKDFNNLIDNVINILTQSILSKTNIEYFKSFNNFDFLDIKFNIKDKENKWLGIITFECNCILINSKYTIDDIEYYIETYFNSIGGAFDSKNAKLKCYENNIHQGKIDEYYTLNNTHIDLNIIFDTKKKKIISNKNFNIRGILMHELLHAYDCYNRLLKDDYHIYNNDIYEVILNMSNSNDLNIRNIGLLLYYFIPTERNALVNQIYGEIYSAYNEWINNHDNNEEFDYIDYLNNNRSIKFLKKIQKSIESLNDKQINILNDLVGDKVSMVIKQIKKSNFNKLFKPIIKKEIKKIIDKLYNTIYAHIQWRENIKFEKKYKNEIKKIENFEDSLNEEEFLNYYRKKYIERKIRKCESLFDL